MNLTFMCVNDEKTVRKKKSIELIEQKKIIVFTLMFCVILPQISTKLL